MKRQEKEKEEQLALANALSRIVLTNTDIIEMGREVVFELKQLMPLNWVTAGLIEESKNLLHLFTLLPKISSDQGQDEMETLVEGSGSHPSTLGVHDTPLTGPDDDRARAERDPQDHEYCCDGDQDGPGGGSPTCVPCHRVHLPPPVPTTGGVVTFRVTTPLTEGATFRAYS